MTIDQQKEEIANIKQYQKETTATSFNDLGLIGN
jgi:hypothetical protein